MPSLHLRNVPDDLIASLARDAAARGQSMDDRAIELLRRELGDAPTGRAALVAGIRRDRRTVRADIPTVIREGRPSASGSAGTAP